MGTCITLARVCVPSGVRVILHCEACPPPTPHSPLIYVTATIIMIVCVCVCVFVNALRGRGDLRRSRRPTDEHDPVWSMHQHRFPAGRQRPQPIDPTTLHLHKSVQIVLHYHSHSAAPPGTNLKHCFKSRNDSLTKRGTDALACREECRTAIHYHGHLHSGNPDQFCYCFTVTLYAGGAVTFQSATR